MSDRNNSSNEQMQAAFERWLDEPGEAGCSDPRFIFAAGFEAGRRAVETGARHVSECVHGRRLEIDCGRCEQETPHCLGRMIGAPVETTGDGEKDRYRHALCTIASMQDEENEWDAVEKYQAARATAALAVTPPPVKATGEPA